MSKKALTFTFISMVFTIVILGVVFAVTQPMVNVAEEFFTLVSQGKIEQAYQLTAADVQAEFTLGDFHEMYDDGPAAKFKSASWHHRSFENDYGYLEGVLKTSDEIDPELDIVMELLNENGSWKIYSVEIW
ncbi:MAG: hypothetical protein ACYSTX_04550 [Planctomycetota bacterium]|jgi:hypothetical protein